MPECRKYKSVVIGENHEDYINKIEFALNLINDKKYLNQELKEAQMNTWDKKANAILKLINEEEDYETKDKNTTTAGYAAHIDVVRG